MSLLAAFCAGLVLGVLLILAAFLVTLSIYKHAGESE